MWFSAEALQRRRQALMMRMLRQLCQSLQRPARQRRLQQSEQRPRRRLKGEWMSWQTSWSKPRQRWRLTTRRCPRRNRKVLYLCSKHQIPAPHPMETPQKVRFFFVYSVDDGKKKKKSFIKVYADEPPASDGSDGGLPTVLPAFVLSDYHSYILPGITRHVDATPFHQGGLKLDKSKFIAIFLERKVRLHISFLSLSCSCCARSFSFGCGSNPKIGDLVFMMKLTRV